MILPFSNAVLSSKTISDIRTTQLFIYFSFLLVVPEFDNDKKIFGNCYYAILRSGGIPIKLTCFLITSPILLCNTNLIPISDCYGVSIFTRWFVSAEIHVLD